MASGSLVLLWKGFSTNEDKRKVKRLLDQSADDISSTALRGDFWRTVIAVSPVILQCQLANNKNRRIQALVWVAIACSALAAFAVLFGHESHRRISERRRAPSKYFTGDGCRRDDDGYYWITGRVDDVINVAGHRLGTAEVEFGAGGASESVGGRRGRLSAQHQGQGIYAYVTLMTGVQPTEELRKELVQWVRTEIGPIASPDLIQFAPSLPKTRSGKIMRRILRKIAEDEFGNLGDTSTLADPAVVDDLVNNRQNKSKESA